MRGQMKIHPDFQIMSLFAFGGLKADLKLWHLEEVMQALTNCY